jgi:iron complex transport system substrate-binding protein
MTRRAALIALALATTVVLVACSSDADTTTTSSGTAVETTTSSPTTTPPDVQTFVGADGVETTIGDVSRIVSLNGDLTEIIFELGLGDTVGFAQQLAAEAVLRFEPTLVIGDQQVGPPEVIEQLRAAGIPVVILETQVTLDGVETKILQVAEILGAPEEGAEVADRVMGEIDAAIDLAAADDSDPKIAYVYVRGPQVLLLFGAGMPTQGMIEGAGAIDAGAETGVFGPVALTPEALLAAAPAVIVLPEAGLAALGGIEAFLELPGVADTPAGQNKAFLAYDEAYFFNLGPRAGQALDEFVRDLYPGIGG